MVGLYIYIGWSFRLPHYIPFAFHMGSQSSVIVLIFHEEAMELAELQRRNESQTLRVVKDAEPHWPPTLHAHVDWSKNILIHFVHLNGWMKIHNYQPFDVIKIYWNLETKTIAMNSHWQSELRYVANWDGRADSLWIFVSSIDAVVLGAWTTYLILRFWCGCSARTSFSSTEPTGNAGSAQRAR